MLIAAEVRDYFESLIKPLVTNESLEKHLGEFQEKIVKRSEEKLDEQNAKIMELQSKIAIQDNALQSLEIKCDDNEQYSRRSCIRIHGVQCNENDDISVINKVEQCCDEIGVKFDLNDIDRGIVLVSSFLTLTQSRKSGQLRSSLNHGNREQPFIRRTQGIL